MFRIFCVVILRDWSFTKKIVVGKLGMEESRLLDLGTRPEHVRIYARRDAITVAYEKKRASTHCFNRLFYLPWLAMSEICFSNRDPGISRHRSFLSIANTLRRSLTPLKFSNHTSKYT